MQNTDCRPEPCELCGKRCEKDWLKRKQTKKFWCYIVLLQHISIPTHVLPVYWHLVPRWLMPKKKMLFLEYFKCLLLQYTKTISILDKSKSVYTSWVSLSCSLCLSLSSLQKSVSARMEVFASMQMAPVNVPQVSLDSTVSLVCPYRNCKQCSSKLWLLVECF